MDRRMDIAAAAIEMALAGQDPRRLQQVVGDEMLDLKPYQQADNETVHDHLSCRIGSTMERQRAGGKPRTAAARA
jgi:hypothetical protein